AWQIASRVEKRMARALPVLRIDRLARVMSTRWASSVRVMRRSWRRSSSLTTMAMSDGPFELFAHDRACGEDAGQDESQEHGEPAAGREAGVEVEGMLGGRDGLADAADHYAQQLEGEQGPGDGLEPHSVGGHERIARAHRLDHGEQPLEDDLVERDGREAEHDDRAQADDH